LKYAFPLLAGNVNLPTNMFILGSFKKTKELREFLNRYKLNSAREGKTTFTPPHPSRVNGKFLVNWQERNDAKFNKK